MRQFYILFLFILPLPLLAQKVLLKGQIVDEQNAPLELVTVYCNTTGQTIYSDKNGYFSFSVDTLRNKVFSVQATYVGRKDFATLVLARDIKRSIRVVMPHLSLALQEVNVTAQRENSENSASSIVFGQEAIEQSQAFSVTDILNQLPGKTMVSPDLQSPKSITLRGESDATGMMNNALGTAIIVDGINQSNNANLQTRNVGYFGLTNGAISNSNYGVTADVPFTGLDLRDIPANNIESIEVVSGVASARYGDLTDGAILIRRQAGETPYQLAARFNGASSNYTLGKGFALGPKLGFLNVNAQYLISRDDPRDRLKSYNRVGGGIIWTSHFSQNLKNTFSFDYKARLDDAKIDPDDGSEIMTWSKNRNITIANRLTWNINREHVKHLKANISYDDSYQESYSQWWLNGNVKPMADKDTTGVYEGYYIPGTYLAIERIKGRPKNLNATTEVLTRLQLGSTQHFLTAGADLYWSANKGQGVISDPDRPRWSGNVDRPYAFELMPALFNYGFFVEDRVIIPVDKQPLRIQAGLRYDVQNGFGTWQPRINTNYQINKIWQVSVAYGIATKAPTMAHRYPIPRYYDIPLINLYTGNVDQSLFLVYTYKYVPDNSQLRASQSNQLEIGVTTDTKMLKSSLFSYYKRNTNGFGSETLYLPIQVPVYNYNYVAGQKPTYYFTGDSTYKADLSYSQITNSVTSDNYGLEWMLTSKQIPALKTSFTFSSAFIHSRFSDKLYRIVSTSDSYRVQDGSIWYVVFPNNTYQKSSFRTKLTADTHIPQLSMVMSLYIDVVWLDTRKTVVVSKTPTAYIDNTFVEHVMDAETLQSDEVVRIISTTNDTTTDRNLVHPYSSLSMRISKEIGKNIRFSVNAFNLLRPRADYFKPKTQLYERIELTQSLGAELAIKF